MIDTNDINAILRLIGDQELSKEDSKIVKKLALIGKQMAAQERMRNELQEIREEFEKL